MTFGKVNFRGIDIYITDERVRKHDEREGLFYYHIRHTDEDFAVPSSIEPGVLVNHFGTVVSKESLDHLYDKDSTMNEITILDDEISIIYDALSTVGIPHEEIA